MASMKMSLLVVAATVLLAATGARAIDTVTGDTNQLANEPAILSMGMAAVGRTDATNIANFNNRKTSSSSAKFYVKCIDSMITTDGATYSLTYALDGAPAVTVGSTYNKDSGPPPLYLEGFDDGDHTLTVTCMLNQYSISTSLPANNDYDPSPLVFKWNVDTVPVTLEYTSTEPAFVNTNDVKLSFAGSVAASAYVTSIDWTCSIEKEGSTPNYKTCKCPGGQTCDATIFQKNDPQGTFELNVKMVVTYRQCPSTADGSSCGDITSREFVKTTTWVRDPSPTTTPNLETHADWLACVANADTCTSISLGNQRLQGTIPTEVGLLTALAELHLESNQLTGSIPSEVGLMVALTSLKIQENQLSCYLPSELGLLTSAGGLSNFLISDNIFEGSIPSELGDLVPTSGFIVGLHNIPKLCGTLPDAFPASIDKTNTNLGSACPTLCCSTAYEMDFFCCLAKNLGRDVANKFCDTCC